MIPAAIPNWPLWAVFTVIMLFSYWLNYCMGSPLADKADSVDTGAILFFFPYWLAKRRLVETGNLQSIKTSQAERMQLISEPVTKKRQQKSDKLHNYVQGREFFTWERSLLCPICLHWWLTLLVALISLPAGWQFIYQYPFQAAFAYLVNHFIIRKIA